MYLVRLESREPNLPTPQGGDHGKNAELADLQDILLRLMLGISVYAHRAAQCGISDKKVDGFTSQAWFAVLASGKLDVRRLVDLIGQALDMRRRAKALAAQFGADLSQLPALATWLPDGARRTLIAVVSRLGATDLIQSGLQGAVNADFHARAAKLAEDPRDMTLLFGEAGVAA